MIYFLLGVVVGGAGTLMIVGIAATNAVRQANHDDADWWKRGETNPDYDHDNDYDD